MTSDPKHFKHNSSCPPDLALLLQSAVFLGEESIGHFPSFLFHAFQFDSLFFDSFLHLPQLGVLSHCGFELQEKVTCIGLKFLGFGRDKLEDRGTQDTRDIMEYDFLVIGLDFGDFDGGMFAMLRGDQVFVDSVVVSCSKATGW